jgi:predicted GNAT superfamily acetyltransferase
VTAITIRPIIEVDELRAVEELQIAVWGMPERDVVPLHHLLAASGAGGRVLGAFTPDGTIIGFCYGFAGMRRGRRLFYSHMAGVLPEYRDRDVGFRLKHAQRGAALADGIDWIVWTYDPLQGGNAYFNLHKLGAETRRYYVNYYGAMNDALNRGSESDRLEVDWWLRDPRVEALMRGGPAPAAPDPGTLQRIDVPSDISSLRRRDPHAAAEWRRTTRQRFLDAFGAAYVAVDAERTADRVTYLLLRRPLPAGEAPDAHRTR